MGVPKCLSVELCWMRTAADYYFVGANETGGGVIVIDDGCICTHIKYIYDIHYLL